MACVDGQFIFEPRVADIAKSLDPDTATKQALALLEDRDRMLEDYLQDLNNAGCAGGSCTCYWAYYLLSGNVANNALTTTAFGTPAVVVGTRPTNNTVIHVSVGIAWGDGAALNGDRYSSISAGGSLGTVHLGAVPIIATALVAGTRYGIHISDLGTTGALSLDMAQSNAGAATLSWSATVIETSGCCTGMAI